jgi:hypothetical protein
MALAVDARGPTQRLVERQLARTEIPIGIQNRGRTDNLVITIPNRILDTNGFCQATP